MSRTFVRSRALAVLSGSLWRSACTATSPRAARPGTGGAESESVPVETPAPYGGLRAPDGNGLALAEGFTSRVIGRSGHRVGGVTWHAAPDGGACFLDGEGWIYVSNSAVPLLGGVSAVRFEPDGTIGGACRILSGTDLNGAGAATPWQTWLSGEKTSQGRVFECDPYGQRAAMPRLAMGQFRHDGLTCDPDRGVVYLTEDEPDGCFYRFRPGDWGDLTTGTLEVMAGSPDCEAVTWQRVPNPAAMFEPVREQVAGARRFNGGEGCHYSEGFCYFTTRGDDRMWAYDATGDRITVLYDGRAESYGTESRTGGAQSDAERDTVVRSGDAYVAEDEGITEITVISPGGMVEPFVRVVGHERSRITGLAFSPDGHRLYFSAQWGGTGAGAGGITYEVAGPFRG
ncbi:PhoX family phosphatase [Planotetraspora phitsanulokensis]|uniref:dTDP-glucose 4,6-dehydratase n=1 Tax=Planotetraspora phitsanulokensis TaxID=575192 RepID=A0A8J3XBQ9_9ACTN|nr:alkaline phosphatase PhoX [Planotetraspora phitsanulokensis]GII35285.1 dTDP-glucose 4,6-dehydratase [Planotetraspora phitsanulokensis]